MKSQGIILLAAIVGVLIITCDTPTGPGDDSLTFSDRVTVQIDNYTNLNIAGTSGARLYFDTVYYDDRDQQFYEGAEVGFTIQPAAGSPGSYRAFILSPEHAGFRHSWTTIPWRNALITLVDLQPAPSGSPIDQDEYEATFQVLSDPAGVDVQDHVHFTEMQPDDLWAARFDIELAGMAGDSLYLDITHGGGCQTHYYVAFARPAAMSGGKYSAYDIYLRHYANGDLCRGIIQQELFLDLSRLARRSTPEVQLRIQPHPNSPDTVLTVIWDQLREPVE